MKNYIGSFLGHYKVLGHLGSGAMSDVYIGYDEDLQIHVAVKVLTDAILQRPELVERFKIEARAAARLNHPNVARVYYFNFKGDVPFFAMELVEGLSLADVLERRLRMTYQQYLDIFSQAVRGLRAAAVRGIIHRDIKPGNLMVGRDGLVKVVDFGLAKVDDEKELTQTGTMMGTPYYLSPEAVRGEELDQRSDIYSLGVTMFQLLVGYPPYDSETPFGLMMQHINSPAPDASEFNDQFPRKLCKVIEKAMAKERAGRYPNHEAVLHALAAVREDLSPRVLGEELAFCAACDVNTIARGDHCSRCKRPYEGRAEPETFYDLLLTGYREPSAAQACATYVSEAVGRREEVVLRVMEKLPFKLGHRLPYERAKTLQRRFYELGGDVEMRRVEDRASDEESSEKLEFVSATSARTASFVSPAPELEAARRPIRNQRLAIIGLASALVLVGGLLLYQSMDKRSGGADNDTEPPTRAPVVDYEPITEPATPEVAVSPTRIDLDLTVEGEVPQPVVDAVEAAVDSALKALQDTCVWEPTTRQSLRLDPNYAFRKGDDARAWEETLGRPLDSFPAGGLEADDEVLGRAAAHWIARAAVADLAGADAPGWLPLGLAYYQEARMSALAREPFEALAGETNPIPVQYWGASPGRNDPENIARAESMVEYLVERAGPRKFAHFLKVVRVGSVEDAMSEVYGESAVELQEGWVVFLRMRYTTALVP